ncbi:prephenate dehydrogenase/arogenate dehydrogenase family protein [Sphingosinicella sp. BN140058]|uniref:prephenate dehydrogenase n=1 Tax=Sphingosinicella sp. BN140058 TaxID=1892855 RepID=UPI0013E9CEE4|nr:prephenate dehydrogenase/arogenate dehydrogenase family protein [Sphingosinicella sp. BN140058]
MRLGIVGTGLIGASLIEAAIAAGAVDEIVAYDTDAGHLAQVRARHAGIVPVSGPGDLEDCDLIFVCTPPDQIASYVASYASSNAIVVDVASIKSGIVRDVRQQGGSPRFVPGHPLSGGTTTGPEEASADIVTRRPFVLTPYDGLDPEALANARTFIERLGAEVVLVDADAHDHVLALISHLPHLLSFAMIDAFRSLPESDRALAERLLPNSFLTVTQFAASDPKMWSGIIAQNGGEIAGAGERVFEALGSLLGGAAGDSEKRLAQLRAVRHDIG